MSDKKILDEDPSDPDGFWVVILSFIVGSEGESGDGRKRFAECAGVDSASAGNR
jgi:hypothetical protein